jgi:hypothetical protein
MVDVYENVTKQVLVSSVPCFPMLGFSCFDSNTNKMEHFYSNVAGVILAPTINIVHGIHEKKV